VASRRTAAIVLTIMGACFFLLGAEATLPPARHASRGCYPRATPRGGARPAACAAFGGHREAWISPDATRGGIFYVSNFDMNEIQLFSTRGPDHRSLGVLTGLNSPQGMTVDRKGNLYVANTNGSDVLVFPRGATSPSRTLADPNEGPSDVAVAPDGTVYVSNETNDSFTGGSVSIYPPGANAPAETLTNSQFYFVVGVYLDGSKNLYVSFNTSPSGGGEVFQLTKHGRNWSTANTGINVTWAGMPAVDDAGEIVEPDQGDEYVRGKVDVFGAGAVLLYAFAGPANPIAVALANGEMRAYVDQPDDDSAQVWTYPGPTVRLRATIPTAAGGTTGIAVDPSDEHEVAALSTPGAIDKRLRFYASLREEEEVAEYLSDGGVKRLIYTWTRPEGIATDGSGNLYVTEDGGSVVRYPRGRGVPNAAWSKGLRYPSSIAVDSRGNMYVADHYPSTDGVIVVFQAGRDAPAYTILDGISGPTGLAVDASGDLFVYNYNSSAITEYLPGKRHVHRSIATCSTSQGGIAFDEAGNLYASDTCKDGGEISVYAPGASKPFERARLPGPSQVAVSQDGVVLAVSSDDGPRVYAFEAQTLAPLGSQLIKFSSGYVAGLAGVLPALP